MLSKLAIKLRLYSKRLHRRVSPCPVAELLEERRLLAVTFQVDTTKDPIETNPRSGDIEYLYLPVFRAKSARTCPSDHHMNFAWREFPRFV